MRVFISWAGESSKALAKCLHDWLPQVLQAVEPFFSEDEIAPGSRWLEELLTNLNSQDFFIACVTHESLQSSWFNFEVGAAASKLWRDDRQRVCPVLWGLDAEEVPQPLGMFQAVSATEDGIRRLVNELNNRSDRKLTPATVENSFQKWWQDLANCFAGIPAEVASPPRPEEEVLAEILSAVRQQAASSNDVMRALTILHRELRESRSLTLSAWPPSGAVLVDSDSLSGKSGLELLLTATGKLGPKPSESTTIGSPPEIKDTASGGGLGKPPDTAG